MHIVSWEDLIVGLLMLGIIWYGCIALRFYRREIRGFFRIRGSRVPAKWIREQSVQDSLQTERQETGPRSDVHALVHELMQELKLVFIAAVRDGLEKDQVLEAVGTRFGKYKMLPAEIKQSVTLHVVNEFSLQLKMVVSAEEIDALW